MRREVVQRGRRIVAPVRPAGPFGRGPGPADRQANLPPSGNPLHRRDRPARPDHHAGGSIAGLGMIELPHLAG